MSDEKVEIQLSPLLNELAEQYASDPQSTKFLPLAEEYRKSNMFEEAIYICQEGIKLHQDYLPGKICLVKCWIETNELDQALTMLIAMEQSKPDNISTLRLLGDVYERLNDSERAAEYYQKVLTLMPDDSVASKKLATMGQSQEETNVEEESSEPEIKHIELGAPPVLDKSAEDELDLDLSEESEDLEMDLTLENSDEDSGIEISGNSSSSNNSVETGSEDEQQAISLSVDDHDISNDIVLEDSASIGEETVTEAKKDDEYSLLDPFEVEKVKSDLNEGVEVDIDDIKLDSTEKSQELDIDKVSSLELDIEDESMEADPVEAEPIDVDSYSDEGEERNVEAESSIEVNEEPMVDNEVSLEAESLTVEEEYSEDLKVNVKEPGEDHVVGQEVEIEEIEPGQDFEDLETIEVDEANAVGIQVEEDSSEETELNQNEEFGVGFDEVEIETVELDDLTIGEIEELGSDAILLSPAQIVQKGEAVDQFSTEISSDEIQVEDLSINDLLIDKENEEAQLDEHDTSGSEEDERNILLDSKSEIPSLDENSIEDPDKELSINEVVTDDEIKIIDKDLVPEEEEPVIPITASAAKVFELQGHHEKAFEIYKSLLEKEPDNAEARAGYDKIKIILEAKDRLTEEQKVEILTQWLDNVIAFKKEKGIE